MNLIEKLHAILVSDQVNVWHYPCKQEQPCFFYWLSSEPHNTEGYGFNNLEELIEAAYAHINPLEKPLPTKVLHGAKDVR